jgi:hypothetical protein
MFIETIRKNSYTREGTFTASVNKVSFQRYKKLLGDAYICVKWRFIPARPSLCWTLMKFTAAISLQMALKYNTYKIPF